MGDELHSNEATSIRQRTSLQPRRARPLSNQCALEPSRPTDRRTATYIAAEGKGDAHQAATRTVSTAYEVEVDEAGEVTARRAEKSKEEEEATPRRRCSRSCALRGGGCLPGAQRLIELDRHAGLSQAGACCGS